MLRVVLAALAASECRTLGSHDGANLRPAGLGAIPEFVRDNPKVRAVNDVPLVTRVVPHDATTGPGLVFGRLLPPNLATEVAFVVDDRLDGAL
jgi:hypothetical protein